MFVLEIELLTGGYRASGGEGAEWPPHPDRVFSALIQAWGDGGCRVFETAALEWLERQEIPFIEASLEYWERTAPVVYVPPNDPRGHEPTVLPENRRRQARHFHVAVPPDSAVRFYWPTEPDEATRTALGDLANRVSSLGHSSSLVRCLVRSIPDLPPVLWSHDASGEVSLRVPYAGRADDLERWYSEGRRPLVRRTERYRLPRRIVDHEVSSASCFAADRDWLVFEDAGGFRPDILGFPVVARRLRDALMSLGEQPPPVVLSGHQANGSPATTPHAAIVPLCNAGWHYATGELLGLAIVPPRDLAVEDRRKLFGALATFVRAGTGESIGQLLIAPGRPWSLEHSPTPNRASLSPERYCAISRVWASVTPVLLDRFPDLADPTAEAALVADSCRYIGLPEPIEIELHKHSAVKGAPSAYPARHGERGADWTMPAAAPYRHRPRRHVVLRFERPVRGPVILGAARYHGMGLCLPLASSAV